MRKAVLAILLLAYVSRATAADIRSEGTFEAEKGQLLRITLSGKITAGDSARVDKLVPDDGGAVIFLNSNGGDYREGLELAKLFKRRSLGTMVESGNKCFSACAIAFLGGLTNGEEGGTVAARAIDVTARLGFHAPFLNTDGVQSEAAVQKAYDHAIRTVTDFVRSAGEFGISAEVSADMMTPQRDQLYVAETVRDITRIGIAVRGIPDPTTITMSMVKNMCANGLVVGETTYETAASQMVDLLQELKWPDEPSIPISSAYMSATPLKGERIVLPMFEGAEGGGLYSCIVDVTSEEGGLLVANRGYQFSETAGKIMAEAKRLDPSATEYGDTDFPPEFGNSAVSPLEFNTPSLSLSLVAPSTPIAAVEGIIVQYISSERAVWSAGP
jgi:hypothetical protein